MTVIIGAGLAGACAALWLADHGAVTVLEADRPAAGTSSAAAGLVNPLMGQKAHLAWHADEAIDALVATMDRAGCAHLFRRDGLLRPARDSPQAESFRERATELPAHATWVAAETIADRYPDVLAPHGALYVRRGGSIDLSTLVEKVLEASVVTIRTGVRVVQVGENPRGAWVETAEGGRIEADRVILAAGAGYADFVAIADLPFHRVKGQTARVARPEGLGAFPPLSGAGYVVPDGDTLVIGSTYEHAYDTIEPTEEAGRQLLVQATRMLPAVANAPILEMRAGIRVTVPAAVSPRRLPLVGPLPGMRRVWIFGGLGSKGLLTAPLLARGLPLFLRDPRAVPPEVMIPAP
jgi:glycine/D-amino acid oxidase-like deaminating enzyme